MIFFSFQKIKFWLNLKKNTHIFVNIFKERIDTFSRYNTKIHMLPHFCISAQKFCGAWNRMRHRNPTFCGARRRMRHRNGSLNFLCRGPPLFLWRICAAAPQKHICLWRIHRHAPQKRCGRMQYSRGLWGPLVFCGACTLVRHRITHFSGAPLIYAPQKG